jgi:hypothetical protein
MSERFFVGRNFSQMTGSIIGFLKMTARSNLSIKGANGCKFLTSKNFCGITEKMLQVF